MPYLHTQAEKKRQATVGASAVLVNGAKQTNLEKWLMIVNTASNPLTVNGKCMMKSIITSSNGFFGGSNGNKSPDGDVVYRRFS